jgi:hypothetical protein
MGGRTEMTYFSELKPKLEKFSAWLDANGAEVLQPTSEWEVLRFLTNKGTSIIYVNKRGKLTLKGESYTAWESFKTSKPWRAIPATTRKRSTPHVNAIRHRDGNLCFFCQELVEQKDESVEHVVSVTHGGPNHLANFVLAHKKCNQEAGHMSAMEKVAIHVQAVIQKLTEAVRAVIEPPKTRCQLKQPCDCLNDCGDDQR